MSYPYFIETCPKPIQEQSLECSFNLGLLPHCCELELPINATIDGMHDIWIYQRGVWIHISRLILAGNPILFSVQDLNEDAMALIQVYDPDRQIMTYTADSGQVYSTFRFTTIIGQFVE